MSFLVGRTGLKSLRLAHGCQNAHLIPPILKGAWGPLSPSASRTIHTVRPTLAGSTAPGRSHQSIQLSLALQRRWNSSESRGSQNASQSALGSDKAQPKSSPSPSLSTTSASSSTSSASADTFVSRITARVRTAVINSISKAASRSGTGSGSDETIKPPTYPDFRRLFSLAGPEKKSIILALAMLLVSSAVGLAVPFTIGKVIDFFTGPAPESEPGSDGKPGEKKIFGLGFRSVVGVLIVVFATGAAARAGGNIMLNLSGVRIVKRIREKCFGNAVRQDVEWADKSHGDVISRLSVDTSIVGDAITYELGDGLRSFLTVIFSGTTMFVISPSLTLLMMAVVPPAAIGAVFYGRYLRDLTNKTQEAVGQMTRTAEERLNSQAFRTLTAFNAQDIEKRRFSEKVGSIATLETKETYASGFFYAGTGFVGNCSILVLLTYGGSLVSRGVITVGDLTSLLMYTAYLGGGLANMTSFFASIMKGVGAGARVFQLVDRESEIELAKGRDLTEAEKKRGSIEFRNVNFEYPSRPGVKVLDGVSLKIEKGESVALVGGSGVGKSSVHALLLRYYDPNTGSVTYGGADIRELKPTALRDQIAVVTQDPILFTGTLFENIAYGCDPPPLRSEVEEAARQANCWEFIEQLPKGLDEEIGARQLSGGQRQRVAIARALCRKPKTLLLDEATSALDAASEYLVNQSISEIIRRGEITVWIVAHRLSTIKSANRIMVLSGGKIVEQGTFDELDHPGSAFRKLVGSQLERDDEKDAPTAQAAGESPAPIAQLGQMTRSFHTSTRTATPSKSAEDSKTTSSHPAIPSKPTWSLKSLIDGAAAVSEPFTTEELEKLHKLAALDPPESKKEFEQLKDALNGGKRLIDAVRTATIMGEPLLDGRVAASDSALTISSELKSEDNVQNQREGPQEGTKVLTKKALLDRAAKTKGGYFVVERASRKDEP